MDDIKIGLVILIGLPASGKTTFSKLLAQSLETIVSSSLVVNVCYDKFIQWSSYKKDGSVTWCQERKKIFSLVENLILCLRTGIQTENKLNDLNLLIEPAELQKFHERIVIIIDDNMYYRSMRYQYYQLARLYGLGFSQVYINCDIQEALHRNSIRKGDTIVPEEVIFRMRNNLEVPDQVAHAWEQYSCSISSPIPIDSSVLNGVTGMIMKSILDPVSPLCDNSEETEMARAACLASVVHQVDLALRKIIGQKMNNQKDALTKGELKKLAKDFQVKKQLLLKQVTEGSLVVPAEICSNVVSCCSKENLLLREFILDQF